MYAIIDQEGKQFRVKEGDEICVDLCDIKEGEELVFDRVLAVEDGADMKIGTPCLEGAKVTAEVQGEVKADKLVVFKYRKRKDSRVRKGHRQKYTKVKIKSIAV